MTTKAMKQIAKMNKAELTTLQFRLIQKGIEKGVAFPTPKGYIFTDDRYSIVYNYIQSFINQCIVKEVLHDIE